MINYQRIKLKFSQLMKHLLFYIPFTICKHSFISIGFTASVYELFENPSYICIGFLIILCAWNPAHSMFWHFLILHIILACLKPGVWSSRLLYRSSLCIIVCKNFCNLLWNYWTDLTNIDNNHPGYVQNGSKCYPWWPSQKTLGCFYR